MKAKKLKKCTYVGNSKTNYTFLLKRSYISVINYSTCKNQMYGL